MVSVMADDTELAYCAGIIDGEGSISITLRGGRGRWRPMHSLVCSVAMTSSEAIGLLENMFGGMVRVAMAKSQKHKNQWIWSISADRAEACLSKILPFLRVKRRQADLGLDFHRSKRRFKVLPPEEIAKRESFRQKMHALNERHGLKRKAYRDSPELALKVERTRAQVAMFLELKRDGRTNAEAAVLVGVTESTASAWSKGKLPFYASGERPTPETARASRRGTRPPVQPRATRR